MRTLPIRKVFTCLDSGPVVLVATHADGRDDVMTVSWTIVLDFDGGLAITTGP